ncbi:MAG: NAD(P)-binding domain-containing protein [Chitinophagaceae bacterium]|nr:NAD(P)-binding domain-containing protein [Chitinophagaceae bacterium]
MNIAILGTGMVGQTIATALIQKGHAVMLGSRTADNEKAVAWVKANGNHAFNGTFADAALFGEVIFICLNGNGTVDALQSTKPSNFADKVVIDLTNPLDFSSGMPPSLLPQYCNTWSLGEEIQKQLPTAQVVKALNTVTAALMIDARLVNEGNHHLFICGNDADAKNTVKHFLQGNFNWKPEYILDLGDIKNARLTEGIIPFWVGVMHAEGSAVFNFMIVK